ncbi:aspartic-type endopeptidase [Venturia nashicola]|uniref:Aspartic-type endopeptidase n=1 Tax=Venturia nashicola TaxID=86259 RepID=A0A4Z1NTU7_9PEZI|nr:aspartic-type endopeptidase [Venturia nashicola]
MYRRWEDATEHPTYNATPPFTSQSYPDANEHLIGSLYIELEGGYNTTISHTELESVERGQKLDGLGEYAPLNNGRIMASVAHGPADYGTDFGMLRGGVFLASTYVFVDYESSSPRDQYQKAVLQAYQDSSSADQYGNKLDPFKQFHY